jgi:inner membrane protein
MSTVDAVSNPAKTNMPPSRKMAFIAAIALATILPSFLLLQLVGEREERSTAARAEIARAWGPEQVIDGPMLVLPATPKPGTVQGKAQYLKLAPRTLDVKVAIAPTLRRRGLFAATVYEATIKMSGRFEVPDGFGNGGPNGQTVGKPLLALTVPGTRGVRDDDRVDVAGVKTPWQSCLDVLPDDATCRRDPVVLVSQVDLSKAVGDTVPFNLELHLRGTGVIQVETAAKRALLHIDGAWPTPSFVGTDLPSASEINQSGFAADWAVDRVGMPQYNWAASLAGADGSTSSVGVDLIEGTPVYRTITRVTKYELLMVALAFSAYFLFEAVTSVSITLVQYAMLGASLTLFSLLLISVSEVTGYGLGYGLSALLITLQASLYTWSVAKRGRPALGFAALLTTVFGFFYVLVALETYALLVGAVALFIVLSVIMGVTQLISSKWRALKEAESRLAE